MTKTSKTAGTKAALTELRRPIAGMTRVGVALGAVGAVTTLVPFAGLAELARVLISQPDAEVATVVPVAAIVVAGIVIGWTCTGSALWITHLADARLQARLRRRLVAKLGEVPLGWYGRTTSGAVRKVAQDDIDDLHHLVAHHDVELAGAIALPAAGVGYLLWIDWRLAVLAVATLPIYVLAYAWMMRGFGEKMVQLDAGFAKVSAAIVDFVHGIAVVKTFGRTDRAHAGYRRAVGEFAERYSGWVRPLVRLEALTSMALCVPVITLTGLTGGIWFVTSGWVRPVDVLAEVLVAVMLPSTLQSLNQGITAQRKAMAAAGRIVDLLAVPPLPPPREPRQPQGHEVVFDDVGFGYQEGIEVLSGIRLTCRPGTVTALVGPSGAGKSTLATLVPRFYDATSGSVRIGGVDVRELAAADLYRLVGFVLQDVRLLHGTVAENLRLGRPGASDDELVTAARAARIHDRINALPQGYDSLLGADVVFSGGEAQRLAIARALLADAPVLVLDEATAHADPESEAEIQDALSELARGRTVLVIAHRLTSITAVDQIVVLENGRITERGRHRELLAAAGPYSRLWAAHSRTEDQEGAVL
ncbi:ABC transporter ATP-binding protein [Kribbella sp. NPDC056861]|uniref:ABC transporter ATP-binding protein n=1 Tax=Kribbella sp. NPDC056861 TaxID=3154857 RepID=UPI0034426E02